jgi:hypothetical protein
LLSLVIAKQRGIHAGEVVDPIDDDTFSIVATDETIRRVR